MVGAGQGSPRDVFGFLSRDQLEKILIGTMSTYMNTVGIVGMSILTSAACCLYYGEFEHMKQMVHSGKGKREALTFNPMHRMVPTSF